MCIFLVVNKNPYHYYSVKDFCDYEISAKDIVSKSGLKRFLEKGLHCYLDTDYVIFYGKMIGKFLSLIAGGSNVKNIINEFFMEYVYIRNANDEEHLLPKNVITRHINWCVNESNRYCKILDQPCKSSIDCAFYQRKH